MGFFWLVYKQDNDRCYLIEEAPSLAVARLKAGAHYVGIDYYFIDGYELPGDAHVLKRHAGRLLPSAQSRFLVAKLQERLRPQGS